MENNITSANDMEALGGLLKSTFSIEKVEVSPENINFNLHFDVSVIDMPPQVKAIHGYVKNYLIERGDPKEEYQFKFYRDRKLIDVLHFNYPDAAHHITIELFGKMQNLRIQDLGHTGGYIIFNDDFEELGWLYPVPEPPSVPDVSLLDLDGEDFYGDYVYPDFSNEAIWLIKPQEFKPYLTEILGKIVEEIDSKAETFEIDVNDPDDVAFWAEQFEISEEELRKAILAAGKSIDDITAYLQH
ncbi:DUF3606 domain-containing protein [Pedobacter sp. MC2016-14]|uniref:DUF3606 domain-containing protein n=1 Tax=Pedobacter sp. MC2016-14 TaxID=2897327 RepID=UPI001E4B5F4B|nr:DUF3606 domain-containing protein [Pedobacter sp. MC2016-14]MCD0489676.1 DUF3606 domain-containing protein [Pedobacter sp. MC2016-14]